MTMKKLIVVVHIIYEQNTTIEKRTIEQIKIAFDNGADGVFLIPASDNIDMIKCYLEAKKVFPDRFIGVNFMNDLITVSNNIDKINTMDKTLNLWTDHGVGKMCKTTDLDMISQIKTKLTDGLIFGGFYFKGNNDVDDVDENTLEQKMNMCNFDVLVTSGKCTGVSIDLELLKKISFVTKNKGLKLGLASGITIDNIDEFVPYVDYFIVGTGVEKDSTDPNIIRFYREAGIQSVDVGFLDGSKIETLSKKIHQLRD